MRNLNIVSDTACVLSDTPEQEICLFCQAAETGDVFYVRSPHTVCCKGSQSWQFDVSQELSEETTINSLTHVVELEALSLTTLQGHLLTLSIGDGLLDEVGLIDGGIVEASWSPEGEILLVISGHANLLMFNKGFDVLEETSLLAQPSRIVPSRQLPPEELEEAVLAATITWQGDGRLFATVSRISEEGAGVLRVWQREGCNIQAVGEHVEGLTCPVAWQPNGRHIYAAQQLADCQSIFLFERNGLSHGFFKVHEKGMVQSLAWSSDSELLAVSLRVSQGQPEDDYEAIQLWSRSNWHWYLKQEYRFPGSKQLMMLWNEEGPNSLSICTAEGELRRIEVGTSTAVSNLGTAAVIDGSELLITPLQHNVVPPPLCTVKAVLPAPIRCVAFLEDAAFEVIAAVLANGSIALLRSMQEDFGEDLLEDMHETSQQMEKTNGCIQAFATLQLSTLSGCHTIRNLVWVSPSELLAIASAHQDSLLYIRLSRPSGDSLGAPDTTGHVQEELSMPEAVLHMIGCPGGSALVQLSSGKMLRWQAGEQMTAVEGFPKPCPMMSATPAASLLAGVSAPAIGLAADGSMYLGQSLVARGVTSFLVRPGFGQGPDYLIYVTKDSFLYTRALLDAGKDLQAPAEAVQAPGKRSGVRRGIGESKHGDNHYTAMHAAMRGRGASVLTEGILKARAVEQGSIIIAAPPNSTAIVLQMPRGNLETIHPRSLVLPAIAAMVQASQWGEAWQMATTHRVDLNLLVDHSWPSFLRAAGEFIRQVADDQDIVDLVSALREDSVTAEGGLYAGLPTPESHHAEEAPSNKGKVALICDALRKAMLSVSPARYLRPLLSCYASQGLLEDALRLLKTVKQAQMSQEGPGDCSDPPENGDYAQMGQGALGLHRRQKKLQGAPTAEDGLAHLLLTVEVDQLYRSALGMYELELAYMIVSHSQRDPGEYLFELRQLAAHPEGPLRKYEINMHLGRLSAALQNLVEAGDDHFDKALTLAKKEGRLRELLILLEDTPQLKQKRQSILNEYGHWLSERNLREDSAVSFLAADNLQSALSEYKEGGHWQMALATAGLLGYTDEEIRELAEHLVENLSESGSRAAAAHIAAEYLRDGDTAVSLLTQAQEWREAVRLAALFNRQDLVETTIAPAAADVAATLLEDFEESRQKVEKYDARLAEVRSRKAALSAAVEGGDEEARPGDFDDTASEQSASSVVSGLSAYTQATTGAGSTAASTAPSTIGGRWPQKKKKKSRKGPKIKQGSPEEEAALIAHIHSLAPGKQLCEEVGQLSELLVLLGHYSDARKLQTLLSLLIARQKTAAENAEQIGEVSGQDVNSKSTGKHNTQSVTGTYWKWDILRPV